MRNVRQLAFIPLLLIMVLAVTSDSAFAAATTRNGSDFSTQAEAQTYFEKHGDQNQQCRFAGCRSRR